MLKNRKGEFSMKKVFQLDELDCANCAAKMERAISALPGVQSVSVNFMRQKLTLQAEEGEFEQVLDAAQKAISRIEPDCRVIR